MNTRPNVGGSTPLPGMICHVLPAPKILFDVRGGQGKNAGAQCPRGTLSFCRPRGSVARRLKAGAASHRKKLAFGLVPQRQSREEAYEEGRTRSGLRSADPVCRLSSGSKEAVGHRRQGPRQSVLRGDPSGLREVEQGERELALPLFLYRPRVDLG